MTMESLVIGRYHRPVNMSLLLAHTARQPLEQGLGEPSLNWAMRI